MICWLRHTLYTIMTFISIRIKAIQVEKNQYDIMSSLISIINKLGLAKDVSIEIDVTKYKNHYIFQYIISVSNGRLIVGVNKYGKVRFIIELDVSEGRIDYLGKCGLTEHEFQNELAYIVNTTKSLGIHIFELPTRIEEMVHESV